MGLARWYAKRCREKSEPTRWVVRAKQSWTTTTIWWAGAAAISAAAASRAISAAAASHASGPVRWAEHKKYTYHWYCILVPRARSGLYRRRSLRVTTHFSAFFQLFCDRQQDVPSFAPLQSLSKLAIYCQNVWWFFSANFTRYCDFFSISPFVEHILM